ncbi:glycosyltransferase family 2 protein [Sinorhizobium numidicum]|uniref:Glycosyltransferase family 2 protein n=1 Tax=Sinorhizobium numidicum TaxID=680248 RepID=A0ABY8CSX2_9HYPH|nr:glycosyltransferase family A protein [Sinorhizobium numidicum]WEX75003.1 glycosyltransferase family 2 protein [Sinorhizobium numidicum]WEX80997.1 glycosyltransferase family 2 protein [Sinorhizobium numidicum]
MHTVDIIVPCYQYGGFLNECVKSALSQQNVQVRVLIIDDASTDNTAEVASELALRDKSIVFHRHKANRGHITTYNEGIEWAAAEFLLLLSADDYLLPGALDRAVRVLTESSELGFAFGAAIVLHEDGSTEPMHPLGPAVMNSRRLTMEGIAFIARSRATNIVPTATAVVRTELQKHVGGYRHDLPHSADMEMWMRLAAQAPVGFVCAYQAVYRQHGLNMSRGYYGEYILRDLCQREKALDAAFSGLPAGTADAIQSYLLNDLALKAIREANTAFNHGNLTLCREILEYAVALSPGCKQSLPWAKLAFKLTIGPANWRVLSSAKRLLQQNLKPLQRGPARMRDTQKRVGRSPDERNGG